MYSRTLLRESRAVLPSLNPSVPELTIIVERHKFRNQEPRVRVEIIEADTVHAAPPGGITLRRQAARLGQRFAPSIIPHTRKKTEETVVTTPKGSRHELYVIMLPFEGVGWKGVDYGFPSFDFPKIDLRPTNDVAAHLHQFCTRRCR